MSFRDDFLPTLDSIRAIPGDFGLHRFRVSVRLQTWTGQRPGDGTRTETVTPLLVGGQNPHVREVRSKDQAAGNGELKEVEYEVGPMTPDWGSGGVPSDLIDPERAPSGAATIQFIVWGPGLPSEGILCQRVSDDQDRPFRIMLKLKAIGRKRA